MELLLLVIIGLLIAVLFIVARSGSKIPTSAEKQDVESFRSEMRDNLKEVREMVQTQMNSFRNEVSDSLRSVRQEMGNRLESTTNIIGQVQTKLVELEASAKQIQEVGKDIASLQNILQPPGLRGGLGELLLERLLQQALPHDAYDIQHSFRDGKRVDAVIKFGQGLVPVDSKFPLESFKRILDVESEEEKRQRRRDFGRQVKQHIDAVADYIRPDEGTMDFALMYIPAENVYYEIILKEDSDISEISEYSRTKKVFPVSPNSFYAYLAAIAMGLKGMKIEQRAGEILGHLTQLTAAFNGVQEDFRVLGTHLNHASIKYEDTRKGLEHLGDRLISLPTEAEASLRLEEPDVNKLLTSG